jgi:hypothetical protein
LQALSAAHVLHALAGEPDRLIADVLRLGPQVWQAELMTLLRARAPAIAALLREPPPRPALKRARAVQDALAERAARSSVSADAPPARSAGRFWRAWMPRRLAVSRTER